MRVLKNGQNQKLFVKNSVIEWKLKMMPAVDAQNAYNSKRGNQLAQSFSQQVLELKYDTHARVSCL